MIMGLTMIYLLFDLSTNGLLAGKAVSYSLREFVFTQGSLRSKGFRYAN